MHYANLNDLPIGVKDVLPEHAQKIYMAVFNRAIIEYANEADPVASASRAAWAAVEREYEKRNGAWVKK